MATTTAIFPRTKGGAFLLEQVTPEAVFTPEDLTAEHLAIKKTTDEFWQKEILPHVDAIRHQDHPVAVRILKKSAELGLTAVVIPEKFGGMEMDLISMMVVAEGVSREGSYSAWHGAHTGIGALPLLFFGNEEQQAKYLPKLAKAEMIGAYCLSEPQAGSDALAARTRADLTPDGKHYVLNGQKMWITNGGYADLYTVFAKIGGEKFTAFLVERGWPGVSTGQEEKKMGIKGSSTTAVFFDNVKVPVENVLGEIGKGHIIAFNILNLGRLKIGPFANGGARDVLNTSIKYAKERKAFGHSISDFGMIQAKLAEMATRIFVSESAAFRVIGMIQAELEGFSWELPDAASRMLKAAEEFAAECSYIKVFASEMLDYVVDEGVQIHGGYGFHQDYAVEHAYRDSRINRIFEGTNEINRLLATGMFLKRAQKGALPLVEAVKKLQGELLSPPALATPPGEKYAAEMQAVENAKKIGLLCLGIAYQKFGAELEKQQEVMAAITEITMNAFALESAVLRARKKGSDVMLEMAQVFCAGAFETIESSAKQAIAACAEGDARKMNLAALKRFLKYETLDVIGLRRKIAARLIDAGKQVL